MTPEELREALAELGIPQRRLARMLGMSVQGVSRWCRAGETLPGYVDVLVEGLRAKRDLERAQKLLREMAQHGLSVPDDGRLIVPADEEVAE